MVRTGYKQTEVGEIPEDWDAKPLSAVCLMKSGASITSANMREGYIHPCYGGNGLRGFTNRFTHDGSFALIGRQGALCGNVQGVSGQFFASEHAIVVTPSGDTDINWLTFVLGRMNLNQYSESSAQPGLSVTKLLPLCIPAPEESYEQKAIAKTLSDVDELIASLENLIAKKRDIKTSTMQQLLTGKKRLPGFGEGKGTKQTEVGEIPEDWDIEKLGSIGEFKNGINKGAEAFGHGYPLVNLMDVFGVTSISLDSELGLIDSNDIEKRVYDLIEGDVIFIRSSVKPTGVGLTSVIDANLLDTVYSGFLIRFRDSGKIDKGFKKYCFYEERYRKRVISASTVSANTNINQDSLKALEIILPKSKHEQKAIGNLLTDMDIELEAIQYRLEKTKAIKQGMMQELLTGRTRLVDPYEGVVEEERLHGT